LTVLKLGLSSILNKINDPGWSREKLISLLTLTDSAIRSVKRISTSLRPGMLDTLGLIATIKWHVNEFSELTGIANELHLPNYIRLSLDRNTAVFRIIQEALTNVARHAQATKVVIHLWKHKGQLVVEIEDDGKGITEEEMINPKSFGIFGMFERSHCLGGRLIIRRGETGGTVITLRLPLEDVNDGVAK
jgi:signal transduction histidine kinase